MMTFEEVAIAFAKQLMRAEQAEAKVVELEAKVKASEDAKTKVPK